MTVADKYDNLGGVIPSFRVQASPSPSPSPSPEPSPASEPSPSPSPSPEPTSPPVQALKLSGHGDQATDVFRLHSGFAVFDATSNGDSNFVIKLVDSSGDHELLVNEIGSYKGKTLAMIESDGEYLMNVTSEGDWSIKISQDTPASVQSAPTKLYGKGDDVVFVNLTGKLTKFTTKHVGESNFVVKVDDDYLLTNEIGNYSGSREASYI